MYKFVVWCALEFCRAAKESGLVETWKACTDVRKLHPRERRVVNQMMETILSIESFVKLTIDD